MREWISRVMASSGSGRRRIILVDLLVGGSNVLLVLIVVIVVVVLHPERILIVVATTISATAGSIQHPLIGAPQLFPLCFSSKQGRLKAVELQRTCSP